MKSDTFSKSKSKICRKSFTIILSVLLVLISTFYSYMPSLDNEFLYWDDQFYVTDNYDITHPDKESLKGIATKIVSLNYHPLTMLSFWINAKINGTSSAKPFILTNVILHVLNVALVFILTLQLRFYLLSILCTSSQLSGYRRERTCYMDSFFFAVL